MTTPGEPIPTNPAPHDSVPIEKLLGESEWVRALARSITRDDARADDVAQDTMARALVRPPDGRGSLRGWIARVAGNLARDAGRRDRRRDARERAVATPEGLPGAGDVLDRADSHRRVVEAVFALDEPYRSTVLMRFFDGLSVRAIARRTGAKPDTVRARVRRAIEILRDRLERDDPERWRLCLLALIRGPSRLPLPAGTGAAASLIGAVLMSVKWKIAVVAAAVLLAVGAFLVPGPEADRSPPAEPAPPEAPDLASAPAPATGPSDAPADAVPPAEAAPEPAEEIADPLATFVVAGRAFLSRRERPPLAGATIRARLYRGYEATGEPVRTATLTSREDGTFEWKIRPPEAASTIVVEGEAETMLAQPDDALVFPGQPAPRDLEVRFTAIDAAVTGRVTDEDGKPLAGATVRWYRRSGQETVTDAEGRYRLAVASSVSEVYVTAWSAEYATIRSVARVSGPGAEATLDFRLRPEFVIRGTVRDETGRPVAGAAVKTIFSFRPAVTAEDGTYRLGGLDPGRPLHLLHAEHPDYASAGAQVNTSGSEVIHDFVLERGGRAEGLVLGPAGEPVPGAVIHVGGSPAATSSLDVTSREDGRFVLTRLSAGPQKLAVTRPGYASARVSIEVPVDRPLTGLTIRMIEGRRVSGVVVTPEGSPIAGAGVGAQVGEVYLRPRAQTDEAGRFVLADLPPETVQVEVFAKGRLRQSVPAPGDEVRITMPPAASLAGTVVDAATGRSIPRFRIRFVTPELAAGEEQGWGYSATWVREGIAFDSPDGTFATENEELVPGKVFGLEASAEGYAPGYDRHVVARVDPDPKDVKIRLSPPVTLTGLVLDSATDAPVAGATVKVSTVANPARSYDPESAYGVPMTKSDGQGAYRLESLAPGEITLVVEHPGYAPMRDGPFDLRTAGPTREVRLVRGATVRGVVRDERGRVAAGAEVRLYTTGADSNGSRTLSAKTDAEGRFEFTTLSAGRHTLSEVIRGPARSQTWRYSRMVTVPGNGVVVADLGPEGTAVLSGTVEYDGDLPAGVTVTVRSADADRCTRATFVENGRFELRGLPAGNFSVTAFYFDQAARRQIGGRANVTLADGETKEITLPVR